MTADGGLAAHDYGSVLREYLATRSEAALYRASLLSRVLLESGLGPEDIIALHVEMLEKETADFTARKQAQAVFDSHQFLLEMMIAYGVHFKTYLDTKLSENIHEAEDRLTREHQLVLEAERIGREKNELLGVIAHEMRNPITAAMSYIELAEGSLNRGLIDSVPSHLGSARSALDRLSRLSGDLVEASREDLPELAFSPIDVNQVLSQVHEWGRPTAGAKEILIERDLYPQPLVVSGNGDGLLSAFGNLLSNAIRYTLPGGRVTIATGEQDGRVLVSFRDTGIGIEPEQIERIFDKFYRAPEARQMEARGLGLGLSLVHQMIRAHGGDVKAESTPGQGSTFRVSLPRFAAEANDA
jgi:signal transduction histidine kinase